jgi:8-oxo-dGTP pyrophosphatase MutT (NUDIX family)
MRPASLQKQTSAGGVIFKKNENSVQIILISVKNGQSWGLPKGIVNKGETTEDAALREVSEETGLTGRIIDKLGDINYWYYIKEENIKCRKTVYFYLMEYVSGDTADHDMEVDKAEWFSLETALEKVSFKGDRNMIEKAIEKLRDFCPKKTFTAEDTEKTL